jgi:hypothetical protein
VTPEARAARIGDAQALLDMLKADDSLPLPQEMRNLPFLFYAGGSAAETRRQFAALESAIPAEFEDGHPDGLYWVVTGAMASGVTVRVYAYARDVAEEVTAVKPVTEWRRLPADEAPESGERA